MTRNVAHSGYILRDKLEIFNSTVRTKTRQDKNKVILDVVCNYRYRPSFSPHSHCPSCSPLHSPSPSPSPSPTNPSAASSSPSARSYSYVGY
jgi:hypothetical protein